jgi:hypothetical protein
LNPSFASPLGVIGLKVGRPTAKLSAILNTCRELPPTDYMNLCLVMHEKATYLTSLWPISSTGVRAIPRILPDRSDLKPIAFNFAKPMPRLLHNVGLGLFE